MDLEKGRQLCKHIRRTVGQKVERCEGIYEERWEV